VQGSEELQQVGFADRVDRQQRLEHLGIQLLQLPQSRLVLLCADATVFEKTIEQPRVT